MKFLLCAIVLSIFSTINAQQCRARFNQSIVGSYSSATSCRGTLLTSNELDTRSCCISTASSATSYTCITPIDFDYLYNTTRSTFLRPILNYGIYTAGVCENCHAKAAFLAIAAAMTNNFQTDEATGTDAQFNADDNKYGNSQEGDGSRYRRRGFFGLRGKLMYERLQTLLPQYQSINNPEAVALTQNSIMIAAALWQNPNLLNGK